MNVSIYLQTAYENTSNRTLGQNKPNQSQFLQKAKMNANSLITTDYENISDWTLGKNKPNTKPITCPLAQSALYSVGASQ